MIPEELVLEEGCRVVAAWGPKALGSVTVDVPETTLQGGDVSKARRHRRAPARYTSYKRGRLNCQSETASTGGGDVGRE